MCCSLCELYFDAECNMSHDQSSVRGTPVALWIRSKMAAERADMAAEEEEKIHKNAFKF